MWSNEKRIRMIFDFESQMFHFLTTPHYINSQYSIIKPDYCWFLAKKLYNFVSLHWRLHNRYCHNPKWASNSRMTCLILGFHSKKNNYGNLTLILPSYWIQNANCCSFKNGWAALNYLHACWENLRCIKIGETKK